jgi:hypothetical protein
MYVCGHHSCVACYWLANSQCKSTGRSVHMLSVPFGPCATSHLPTPPLPTHPPCGLALLSVCLPCLPQPVCLSARMQLSFDRGVTWTPLETQPSPMRITRDPRPFPCLLPATVTVTYRARLPKGNRVKGGGCGCGTLAVPSRFCLPPCLHRSSGRFQTALTPTVGRWVGRWAA